MSTSPLWIQQLTRTMIRKNDLKPSDLDVPDVRNPIYVSSASSETGDNYMKATFLFKEGDGNYNGAELFTYETVNLEKLFKNNSVPVVWGYNPHTTKAVAKLLIDQYGLSLHEDWFVDEPIDGSTLPTHFTIKTKQTDWCSASQLTVRVEQSEMDVAELFTVDVLDAPSYIVINGHATYGKCPQNIYTSYGKDFTPNFSDQKEQLISMTPGYYTGQTLSDNYRSLQTLIADVLSVDVRVSLTIQDWQWSSGPPPADLVYIGEWNCLYNGTTKGCQYNNVSADTSYDKVLVLTPSFTASVLGGRIEHTNLFIHYNDV